MRTSKGQDIMIDDFVTMIFLHHEFYCMLESACYIYDKIYCLKKETIHYIEILIVFNIYVC